MGEGDTKGERAPLTNGNMNNESLYPNLPGYNTVYSSNNFGQPINYSQYAFQSAGYQYHPIVSQYPNSNVRTGTSGSKWTGFFVGFYFPIITLPVLCCSRTLKLKHGLCIGHSVHFALASLLILVLAVIFHSFVFPATCTNLSLCEQQVINGTDSGRWAGFLVPCNNTDYMQKPDLKYIEKYMPFSHELEELTNFKNGSCPLPQNNTYFFHGDAGPQSPECASCVCSHLKALCDVLHKLDFYLWICFAVDIILFIVFICASKHYGNKIYDEERKYLANGMM